jgi:hypothetical protein
MTTPKTVPEMVDAYVETRAIRLKLDKESAKMKEAEEALKADLITYMNVHGQGVVASEHTALTLNTRMTPTAEDWEAIQAYVEQNSAFDLLTHKLSPVAVTARWEAGEVIPGIGRFMVRTLSISKLNKG